MSFGSSKWKEYEKLINRISLSIVENSVSHAYIFEGDVLTDKMGFAIDFLKAISCREIPGKGCDECLTCRKIEHRNYTDLYIVEAEFNASKTAKSIRDEAIEELQSNLARKSVEERTFAIIENADTMTKRAQNRLLKTLEEPNPGTVIVLLSENRENLLETVRSRCIAYRLNGISDKGEGEIVRGASEIVDGVIRDASFFDIKNMLAKYAGDRDKAMALLDGMETVFRNIMLAKDERYLKIKKERVFRAIELIEEARRDILINVNYSYALKNLLIKL